MPKPPHEPTDDLRDLVSSLVLAGLTQDKIAMVLKISESTLKKHYKQELTTGHMQVVGKSIRTIYQKAMGGNLGAAIFIAKTKGGFKETVRNENFDLDLTGASEEDLITLEKYLKPRSTDG